MAYYYSGLPYSSYLMHFGIKGQKWGIRRFQNPDGTLTEEGWIRYRKSIDRGLNLMSAGQTKGKVIARTALNQAGMTAAAILGSANAFKYKNVINSKYFKAGAELSKLATFRYGLNIKASDALKYRYLNGAGLSNNALKNIVMYKGLSKVGSGMKKQAAKAFLGGKVLPAVSNLGYLGYGVGTAANLYNGIRDYRDIRNAEIAKGFDRGRRR